MKRIVSTFLLLTILTGWASAQSRGSYFFENSLLRSKLNPAFAPKTNYATPPILGNLSFDAASNIGLRNFIYPQDENNVLFLNDNVPAETFLSQLPRKDPYVRERLESDLFGAGMRIGQDGYATLAISLVEYGSVSLSNDLLRFLKTGSAGTSADVFGGGSLRMAAYAAISAGYSHDLHALVEGLRAGVRLKILTGVAAADLRIDQIGLKFGEEQLSASIRGNGSLSGIGYDPEGGFSFKGISPLSIGAAIDLGASYQLPLEGRVESLELSASVCDLGAIRYRNSSTALGIDNSFSFTGFHHIIGGLDEEIDQMIDDIGGLTHINISEKEHFRYALSPSIHIGATARMFHDKLNAGLLYYHAVGSSNLMAACGYSPLDWINLGVNWTFLGPANRLGFYVECIPVKYAGFFFGMERASWRRNSYHLPVRNATDSFSFGINILFGK